MTRITRSLIASFLFLLLHLCVTAQTSGALPRSTPEAEGVSSEGIIQFLDAIGKSKHEMHSMMLLRHGKVVAEGWWNPYRPDLKHTLYSVSKSFTATAIGFAVHENLLTVNDQVISFFPNDLPDTISPMLADLRISDLLSMSAGQDPEPSTLAGRDSNWVKLFLATPIVHQPGSKFLYNSYCTYMLSAIIQKVTGEKLVDYLAPRLFAPLGIEGMDWEMDPRGTNTGGWGLRLKTEDMAKFGQLFLQNGKWNDEQLLPKGWTQEASTLKIIQHPDLPQSKKDSSDWEQGYGYQMWRSRHNAFRADGAFGQFIIVMPDQDAVLVITSETTDMQDEFNYIWKYLYPAIQEKSLPANKKVHTLLQQKLSALALPLPEKSAETALTQKINGRTFELDSSGLSIQELSFHWENKVCHVLVKSPSDTFQLAFGSNKWVYGTTRKLGPSLVMGAWGHFVGLPASQVAGAYRWSDANTLELTLRYIDSPHTETFLCSFSGDEMSLEQHISFAPARIQTAKGTIIPEQTKKWWKEAVVYQIYPRSFKDSDGDGIGDLKGIISKLDYVKSLGIDMVWLNPIYASPNKDNGYDISDYQSIMKEFGTMADFDTLLTGFHNRGIKVMMDLVVNHCSDEHAWFQSARSSRNSPYYNYFHWWPAEKGKPPYRWSIFDDKGDAWEYNKATDSYYLHYFADAQPDLNWENPQLRQEIYKMMRFWLDKGIDGFRLDAIAFCSKDTDWPPLPAAYKGNWGLYYASGPHLHEYMQEMNREVLSKYDITTVAEAMGDVDRVMKFVDPARKELDMAYYFEAIDYGYLPNEYKMPDPKGYDLVAWKKVYAKWTEAFAQKGWGTIYLANHDQPRMVTRWGNDNPAFHAASSKMLTTFILSMRGTAYYYYGDEIGMKNIRFDNLEDYNDIELRTNYNQVKAKGGDLDRFLEGMKISSRDNGRTPMQWDSTDNAGFTRGFRPWLKVNPDYLSIQVDAEEKSANSILQYFRKMIQLRKSEPALLYGDFALVDSENPSVFAYTRSDEDKKLLILLNFKALNATYDTGLNLTGAKILLSNFPNSVLNGRLRPYEAVVVELK